MNKKKEYILQNELFFVNLQQIFEGVSVMDGRCAGIVVQMPFQISKRWNRKVASGEATWRGSEGE